MGGGERDGLATLQRMMALFASGGRPEVPIVILSG